MVDSSQQFDDDFDSDNSSVFDERHFIRVSTAPARPLTDLEEFKRSTEFILLEQTILLSTQLIQKDYQKYDLDTPEGQRICKKYLNLIEKLCEAFSVNYASREYREEFSKAYKILYKEGNLCYLTEILDSAQEAFPYLWVNGEKYIFSPVVLEAGSKLLSSFYKMQNILRNAYSKTLHETMNSNSDMIKSEIVYCLEDFDYSWAKFEEVYVTELMLIEKDARRYITNAIEIEKELESIEIREKLKGRIVLNNEEYHNLRRKLCKEISQINSVANVEGKGRDDLEFQVLLEAEGLIRRITKEQSRAVRTLADDIRNSFMKLRQLFRKYEQNIEMVDPQLKNNADLTEALMEYETSWEKGKNYFLDGKKCNYLIHFSHVIEATSEKYKEFQEQIECRDADIFVIIPCVIILKSLDNEDKNICNYFLPELSKEDHNLYKIYNNLKEEFIVWRRDHLKSYEYYNVIEKMIIAIPLSENEKNHIVDSKATLEYMIQKIKQLAIELQRHNPTEWNNFLDAALISDIK